MESLKIFIYYKSIIMKKYRITGKSYYKEALKHRVKETDSKEEAREIYVRFSRKYFGVRLFVDWIFTDPKELYDEDVSFIAIIFKIDNKE